MGDATERPKALDVRDYFASAALQGIAARSMTAGTEMAIAREAYALADAMLQVKKTSDAPAQ